MGHSTTPGLDLFVSIAGPLTHIPQFLIWFAILAISGNVVYHGWTPSLSVPDPRQHFWLAICAGASQVTLPAHQHTHSQHCRVEMKPASQWLLSLHQNCTFNL